MYAAAVASGCDLTATEPIEIWVVNQGSVADSAFNLSYSVNGGTTIFETINSYLNPGDTLKYVFTTTADMSADGIYDIDFECLLAVDADTTDNYFNFVAENYVTPADAITIGDTICIGDTAYISAVGVGYITWYDAATGGNEIGDDEDLIVTPSATTSYYAQVEAIEEFDDDFESYSDGDLIAQSSIDWNTWSGTTGAGDDAEVTNAQASSSSNSLYLNNADGDDIVLPFGRAFSTGYFAYSMDMYIVTDAYFNFQSDVTIGIGWAFDVFLSGGIIDVQIGGLTYLTGSYPTGSPIWFNIEFKGDLDNDTLELFTNGNSQGTFQITSPLAAVNIYANTGNEYYIDNVEWGAYGGDACRSISRTEAIVSVNNQSISTDSYTACDSLTWIDGNTYTSNNNTATYTLTNAAGCDSIVTLNLTVSSSTSSLLTISSCGSYLFNGQSFFSSGIYVDTSVNTAGCPQIDSLDLTITTVGTKTVQSSCDSFLWNGTTYNSSGTYTSDSSSNCVDTLVLTISEFLTNFTASATVLTSPPFNVTFTNTTPNISNYDFTWDFGDGTILQNNNSNVSHDFLYNGLYSITLIAQDINTGCTDTMYKQDYIICNGGNTNCNNTGTDTQNICGSFTWINGNTYTSSNNTATYTLTNAAGCDSVVTLNLTIKQDSYSVDNQSLCGGSFTWINGNTYNASNNTATDTLTNAAGCDSIVTLNLTISQTSSSIDNQILCDGNTLNWIDGNTYTSSNNTATDTLTNAAGCDSIVTLNLTVSSSTSSLLTISSCGSYLFNGQSLSSSGIYVDTSVNAAGCPQIDSLDLTITTVGTTTVQSSCDSFLWNGTTYNSSGTYTSDSSSNCVDTLVLTISEFLTNFIASPTVLTSPPFNVTFTNTTPNISNYDFTWDFGDGTLGQTNIPSFDYQYMSNGIYDVSLIAEDITNGCGYDTLKFDNLISCSGGPVVYKRKNTDL